MHGLTALAVGVGARPGQPVADPVHPVAARDDESRRQQRRPHRRRREQPARHARGIHHRSDDPDENQRGPEVVTGEDQADRDGGDRHEIGNDGVRDPAQRGPLVGEDERPHEDQADLGELGRLQRQRRGELEPVAVATLREPKTGDEDQRLQHHGGGEGGHGQTLPPLDGEPRGDERSDQPDAGEARLVEEHGIRRAVVLVGGDHRRRQDHDQPDEQQRCGDPDEDVVGGHRAVETGGEGPQAGRQPGVCGTGVARPGRPGRPGRARGTIDGAGHER